MTGTGLRADEFTVKLGSQLAGTTVYAGKFNRAVILFSGGGV
jgi:hypothetical protein